MSQICVVYASKSGSSQKYAEWIAEELACDIVSLDKAKRVLKDSSARVIFVSLIRMNSIWKLKNVRKLRGENLTNVTVMAVGGSPQSEDFVELLAVKNGFVVEDIGDRFYYARGVLNRAGLKGMDKFIINMVMNMMEKSEILTPEQQSMYDSWSSPHNYMDKNYIIPLIEKFKSIE